MIDININTIISQALAAAVQQAIQPLQQEYANKMAEMAEKITALEMRLTLGEKLTPERGVDTALTDRVAALENQALVVSNAVDKRIAALENNPAQGVDTTLEEAAANKDKHERQLFVLQHLTARVTALENNPAQGVDTTLEETLQRLDNQEWFWDKLRNFTDSAVEQAIEEHKEEYDHNDFVTEDKLDDYVQKDSFRDEIEDVLNNATIRFRF